MKTHTIFAAAILLLCIVSCVAGDEADEPKAGGWGGDKVNVVVSGNGPPGQLKRAARAVFTSNGCNRWLATGNPEGKATQQPSITMLLGFNEYLDLPTLRTLSPGCNYGQASHPACQKMLADAGAAHAAVANMRYPRILNFLRKLGLTILPSQIIGVFSLANIMQINMTQPQVTTLMKNFQDGVVPDTDSDYLELRSVEWAYEPLVTNAPGACNAATGSTLYSFSAPKVHRLATTADSFYQGTANFTQLRVAVFDQGLNVNHTLVRPNMGLWGDCATTSATCAGTLCTGNCCRRYVGNNSALDTCASYGTPQGSVTSNHHGTACVAAVAGNSNCTADYRGGANVVVDFFRAMFTVDYVNAFQAAVRSGDKIISTSLGVNSTAEAASSTSLAADSAFDAGVITFAAAGNFGCSRQFNGGCTTGWGFTNAGTCTAPIARSIMSPANAHKAIAVGAYSGAMVASPSTSTPLATIGVSATSLRSVTPMCYSGRGPTNNGRIKPDIMGPTGIDTAYTTTNGGTTALSYFSGTSAATPNAAAAFASFYSFRLNNQGTQGMPTTGQFMASIIAAGENYGVPNNNVGAGAYRPGVIHQNGTVHAANGTAVVKNAWASFTLMTIGATGNMTGLTVTDTSRAMKCAAWWPASASAASLSNIDLRLIGPTGSVVASSLLTSTVWEKVALLTTPAVGTYTLSARLVSLSGVSQAVHLFCFY